MKFLRAFFLSTLLIGQLYASGGGTLSVPFVDQLDGQIDSPGDKTYRWRARAMTAGTIDSIYVGTESGTITAAVKINGTNVTGLSAISVSSAGQSVNATAANTFVAGDQITLVTSSNSSALDLYWSIKITRR